MTRKDYKVLIEALLQIRKLDMKIMDITGGSGISAEMYRPFDNLYELIQDHSVYKGREDDDGIEQFDAILYAINISTEEKCERLFRGE